MKPPLTIDQGAALLWLRQAGGRAQCDRAGTVSAGRKDCPITFPAFGHLDHAGLVQMRLPADILECRLLVLITEAGVALEIDPAAERRLDQLMRRFDD
ncbi:hypothetical protein [Pleomorphomonas sp. JP5]|uniref:hypothetical protein n=1 Tax=Pleomorphomonas sp. JP5 TaxID=2942998 RepID=UPI0020449150|nr:hypothetical protein [Pleomorphomonas sp. JP5]MCM5556305.1 hypothetical protein [Pleomorphomonas sp. JP5]